MALVTKCSHCNAIFRITFPELQLCDGKVRCGQCEQPFNAFNTLISVPESVIETGSSQPTVAITETIEKPAVTAIHHTPSNHQPMQEELVSAMAVDQNDSVEVQPISRNLVRRKIAVNLVLMTVLCLQLVYFYRTELAIAIPSFRPFLERSCDLLQCEVQLPKYSTLLSLESSELRVNPNHQGEIVTLLATIRNHAPFQQAWPEILLTLTDLDDQPIASRILLASDYLMDNNLPQFFAPDSEIEIKIYFDNNELKAMGYRLELIYL